MLTFEAGMLFAPTNVGFLVASLSASKFIKHIVQKTLILVMSNYGIGLVLLVALVLFGAYDHRQSHWMISALLVFGFGQGLSMTPLLMLCWV
ncbi:hypothetical protein [Bartonella tamiae]|uniref:Major facilitator superfamily (MFS) profile domain-containing protein n=1 Tax=Bartonella tamiae Th239 TaxID=1094558 RepID=J0QYH2_9HYPH|nr:hypothetical protein [Bartonella tamiae]EJF91161.1 hypothetical protein ME5_00493 [Bartonella tamiae Th239]